jgi:hypothetical protein
MTQRLKCLIPGLTSYRREIGAGGWKQLYRGDER